LVPSKQKHQTGERGPADFVELNPSFGTVQPPQSDGSTLPLLAPDPATGSGRGLRLVNECGVLPAWLGLWASDERLGESIPGALLADRCTEWPTIHSERERRFPQRRFAGLAEINERGLYEHCALHAGDPHWGGMIAERKP
jgi:hypothetical protein